MSELVRRAEQMKAQFGSLAALEGQIRSEGVSPDDHRLYTDLLEWYAIDHELAELMHTQSHPLHDVVDFEIVGDYRLRVAFDDGAEQVIDFRPVLYGEMYGPLRDLRMFNQVRLDREVATLVWPNGADFDPWMLHEWPELIDELSERARQWDAVFA